MFHEIPATIRRRMEVLEGVDARDRRDLTAPRAGRLRQITPETGRFLAILAASAPEGRWVEIGTSAGYSALWLALACREMGRKLTTFEIQPAKATLARETFREAGVEDVVELIEGNALERVASIEGIGYCFLDLEKEAYRACYEAVVPRMVRGGLLAADNVVSHADALRAFVQAVEADTRADSVVVPIGKGVLVCRKR